MLTHNPDNNLLGLEPKKKAKKKKNYGIEITGENKGITLYENNIFSAPPPKKKKPTGILKDLLNLDLHFNNYDEQYVLWSDVEAIINKYYQP